MTLTALVGAGLAAGLVLLPVGTRAPDTDVHRWIGGVFALLLCAASMALALGSGVAVEPQFRWVGQIESVHIHASGTGGQLAALAWGALALSLLWPGRMGGQGRSRHWPVAGHVLCALVVAALTIDQFLARIVLLDLVSIGTALAVSWQPESDRGAGFLRSYLVLRLGDMALLGTVLALYAHAGTFRIDEMIESAAGMPRVGLTLAGLAGLAAAWVKLGLPPAHRWAERDSSRPPAEAGWLLGAGLPLLGAYLLYRIRPLLTHSGVAIAAAAVSAALLVAHLVRWARAQSGADMTASSWDTIHGALGMVLLPTPIYRIYLVSFVPARLAISFLANRGRRHSSAASMPGTLLALPNWLSSLCAVVWEGDRRILQDAEKRLIRAISSLAEWCALRLEHTMNRCVDRTAGWAASASAVLRRQHTGKLRLNLCWVVVMLILIVLASVSWPLY